MNKQYESKHTPGPWEAIVRQHAESPQMEIDCDAGMIRCPLRMPVKEVLANAKLIAVAPELLAALERINRTDISTFGGDPKQFEEWLSNFTSSIISKATL